MLSDKRLEKVVQTLSGKERAVLFLREYKDGLTTQITTPAFLSQKDYSEYARLVNAVRVCNNELADVVLIVKEQLAQEELRFHCMQQMRIAADDLWMLALYIKEEVKEPITKSELAVRRKKPPVAGFDVYEDENADQVALLRDNRRLIDQITARGCRFKLPFDMDAPIDQEPKRTEQVCRLICAIVRANLETQWTQLQAVATVIAEYAEQFDGEDPLRPRIREFLDDALARIGALKDELMAYVGPWQLPDDHSESLRHTRALVERVLG